MFTWVTARYLQREKCQCKFEKGRNNVIQKVKTLQFFFVCIEHLLQARKRDLGSTNFTKVLTVLCRLFDDIKIIFKKGTSKILATDYLLSKNLQN